MDEHTLEPWREAIRQALEMAILWTSKCWSAWSRAEGWTLEELVEKADQRMQQEDFISVDEPFDRTQQSTTSLTDREAQGNVR